MFAWMFGHKKKTAPRDPNQDLPTPARGEYANLPRELEDFDWTDYDAPILSVDGDGTVKLHAWYARREGIAWESSEYITLGWITPPGAQWVNQYWMRPSFYDELIAKPAAIASAREVSSW